MKKEAQKPQEMVNHPSHYSGNGKIECIDFIGTIVNKYPGIIAGDIQNICKYIWRAHRKNGKIDVQKAQWYYLHAKQIWNSLDERTRWVLKCLPSIPMTNSTKTRKQGIQEITKEMEEEERTLVLTIITAITDFYNDEKRSKGEKALTQWIRNFDTFDKKEKKTQIET